MTRQGGTVGPAAHQGPPRPRRLTVLGRPPKPKLPSLPTLSPRLSKTPAFLGLSSKTRDFGFLGSTSCQLHSFSRIESQKTCKSGPRARRTPRSSRKRSPDERAGLAGTLARPPTRRERPHRRWGKDEHGARMESQDLFQGPQAAREDEEEALSALSGGEDGAAGTISVVPSRRDLPCRRVWLVNRNPFLENEDQRKMTSWELEGWD